MTPAIITGIEAVFNLLSGIQTIKSLCEGHDNDPVNFEQMKTLVDGGHADFFNTVTGAHLTHIRDSFYTALLTINEANSTRAITSSDLLETRGRLSREYRNLEEYEKDVASKLATLAGVVERHGRQVHPDELISVLVALFNGYRLLFHILSTYSQLHRIAIGASSLDHRSLNGDTNRGIQYVDAALRIITKQQQEEGHERFCLFATILWSRLWYVTAAQGGPNLLGSDTKYYFKDEYYPLSSTPSDLVLFETTANSHHTLYSDDTRSDVKSVRDRYHEEIKNSMNTFVQQYDLGTELSALRDVLATRKGRQAPQATSGAVNTKYTLTAQSTTTVAMLGQYNLAACDLSVVNTQVASGVAAVYAAGDEKATDADGKKTADVDGEKAANINETLEAKVKLDDEEFARLGPEEIAKISGTSVVDAEIAKLKVATAGILAANLKIEPFKIQIEG